ncbi:hypothetical protein NITLEN_70011 [Nitrospira lenta]|uniref:Uncharacterized protein n=1 Tax=Nitrospira lenta TaxID=1436998 RepID=A0A330L9N1_9BACT|nr:hypothetical protein NITLEN_70011 [Nitrospira lenta]
MDSAILHSMYRWILPQMLMIGRLALLICLWTTSDRVIDLVFEEPDVAVATEASADEPDNAAEHLLMPSERTVHSPSGTLTSATATDLDTWSIAISAVDHAAPRAAPPLHTPPKNTPASFSVPLRI